MARGWRPVSAVRDDRRKTCRHVFLGQARISYWQTEADPCLLACLMGLQHAMAMIGGLITPPLVVIKFTVCGFAQGFCPDLVQVSSRKRILLMKPRQIDSVVVSHFCRFWDQFLVRCQCRFDHLWYLHHYQYPQASHSGFRQNLWKNSLRRIWCFECHGYLIHLPAHL